MAQTISGRVSGTVVDASGGVLPGVVITVSEEGTGFSQTTATDERGAYVLVNLPLGNYKVSAELQGFKPVVRSGYVLTADGRVTADFKTGLGINTSINGSRTNANLLTVDGGFNMDSGSNNSQISNVSIDAIQELSVKTSNYSAEYGRNSGAAINVVTRGGTNRFRGSGCESLRREELDANDAFANARGVAKPELKYDNFGGTLGGPIMKDKLFFFGSLDWRKIRRSTAPVLRTLPPSAGRTRRCCRRRGTTPSATS
jgi:hypothetical protein